MSMRSGVIIWMIAGGMLGAVVPVFVAVPFTVTTGVLLGLITGGAIGFTINRIRHNPISKSLADHPDNIADAKILLREEELDISKKWTKTGDVTIYKEIIQEEKKVIVPVTREEIVIQKRVLNATDPNASDIKPEIIRIPLSEEQIQVSKHKVILNDISAYKHKIEETLHIDETLKKEKLHLDVMGNPVIVESNQGSTDPPNKDLH